MGLFRSRGKHARGAQGGDSEGAPWESSVQAEDEAEHQEAQTSGEQDAAEDVAGDAVTDAASGAERDVEQDVSSEGQPPAVEPMAEGVQGATFGEIPDRKKRKGLKAFGVTLGVFAGLALVAYVVGAVVFMGRFLPNTTIGAFDVSMKTDDEVVKMLDSGRAGYRLDVLGNGFSYRASGADIGLEIDSAGVVAAMHEDLNEWAWPRLVLQPSHDETDRLQVEFKREAYEDALRAAIASYNETAAPPVNATIAYDAGSDRFVVEPERAGTQLDTASVLEGAAGAISGLKPKLQLTQADLVQPTVLATDEKLIASAELATGLASADVTMNMGGVPVGEVDGETLSTFITIDENLDVTFKEDELGAWLDSLAAGFNTVDTARTYTRADGKQISVSGGAYGWEVDAEGLKAALVDAVRSGAQTQIEIPCYETAAVYNGAGQRDWGNRYLDVDLSEQHVRFYGDDGAIIWEAPCITGKPDGSHNTVEGVWYVNSKESPSKLIGYENGKKIYETTVTYWMPFEGNGIGFHDATWQPSFGGSMYANGYGSHGCVNLSYSAAQSLYDIIYIGDVVVVHS